MLAVHNPSTLSVRIVTYNVLSSLLSDPSRFVENFPTHLDASHRLPKVLMKLSDELSHIKDTTQSQSKVIFCLQEVSRDWAGHLHKFFANRNYAFVTGLYGKKCNGYMGVGLAYSTDTFETLSVNLGRVSDNRVEGWPHLPKEEHSLLYNIRSSVSKMIIKLSKYIGLDGENPKDIWHHAESRQNMMVCVHLKPKTKALINAKSFWVGTYHMPCAFYEPPVMNIHADMAATRIQSLAKNNTSKEGDPYILAGDFNILPNSPHYQLLTKGYLDWSDPTYPPSKYEMTWVPTLKGMNSAYAIFNGGVEPKFTNYAKILDNPPFIETIDYVFLSKNHEWKVKCVKKLKDLNDGGPYPNDKEPSDHLLLAVDLEL